MVVRYSVKKYDEQAHREAGVRSTPPIETVGSDESDTAPSGGATPRGPSPAREDEAGASQSGPRDEGSTDEAETWHTAPMPYYQGAAACMSRINTYYNVRLADIVGADPTEQQGTGGGTGTTDSMPVWPMESTPDDHTSDKQPSDTLQGAAGRYNWRADLTDNTYRYDTLVEPPGLDGREQPATATGDLPPKRALTHWIDDIHGRGGTSPEDGNWPTAPSPITTAGSAYLHTV